MEIRIEITPIAKPRMTRSDKWNQRDCVMRYRSYCDELRKAWGDRTVPDRLNLVFTIPMPASWSKKRRSEMVGKPHQSKPDIDNLLKGFLDGLLDDDARIWDVRSSKIWGESGLISVENTTINSHANDRILCAAIHFDSVFAISGSNNEQIKLPLPVNIETGTVVAGRRHSDCMAIYLSLTGQNPKDVSNSVDGFLTTSNRFVDRYEAFEIADRANQLLPHVGKHVRCLISEMLYIDRLS